MQRTAFQIMAGMEKGSLGGACKLLDVSGSSAMRAWPYTMCLYCFLGYYVDFIKRRGRLLPHEANPLDNKNQTVIKASQPVSVPDYTIYIQRSISVSPRLCPLRLRLFPLFPFFFVLRSYFFFFFFSTASGTLAMSLKAELETWAGALKAYDDEDFEKSLDLFSVHYICFSRFPMLISALAHR